MPTKNNTMAVFPYYSITSSRLYVLSGKTIRIINGNIIYFLKYNFNTLLEVTHFYKAKYYILRLQNLLTAQKQKSLVVVDFLPLLTLFKYLFYLFSFLFFNKYIMPLILLVKYMNKLCNRNVY